MNGGILQVLGVWVRRIRTCHRCSTWPGFVKAYLQVLGVWVRRNRRCRRCSTWPGFLKAYLQVLGVWVRIHRTCHCEFCRQRSFFGFCQGDGNRVKPDAAIYIYIHIYTYTYSKVQDCGFIFVNVCIFPQLGLPKGFLT